MSAPSNTYAPTIAGNPVVGHTLRCFQGVWTDDGSSAFTYQWQRAGVDISSATSDSYVLVSADDTHAITCNVTDTDTGGATTQASDSVTVGASQSITWNTAARPVWEPDTIFLLDPDLDKKFWGATNGGLLDYHTLKTQPVVWNSGNFGIVPGKFRRGLSTSGTAVRSDMGSFGPILPSAQFTVELWVSCSVLWSSAPYTSFWSSGSENTGSNNQSAVVRIDVSSGKPRLTVDNYQISTPVVGTRVTASAVPAANTWTHLAVTYNGTTLTFYVNGVSQGTISCSPPTVWSALNGMTLFYSGFDQTAWSISDLRVSRVCRIPSSPVTAASLNTVAFSSTPRGDTISQDLRSGLHGTSAITGYIGNTAVENSIRSLYSTVRGGGFKMSTIPIKAGATDSDHPTLGHSGSYSYHFGPIDHEIAWYSGTMGLNVYLDFASTPQLLGGSSAPATTAQCNDPTFFDSGGSPFNTAVPSDFTAFATMAADMYYHVTRDLGITPKRLSFWNEPDIGTSFWAGTETQLLDLYKATVLAIQAIDPGTVVDGFDGAMLDPTNSYVTTYLSYCGTNSINLGAYSAHLYNYDIGRLAQYAKSAPGWVSSYGLSSQPEIILGEGVESNAPTPDQLVGYQPAHSALAASHRSALYIVAQQNGVKTIVSANLNPSDSTTTSYSAMGVYGTTNLWAAANMMLMWKMLNAASVLTTTSQTVENGVYTLCAYDGSSTWVLATNWKWRRDRITDLQVTLPAGTDTTTTTYYLIDEAHSSFYDTGTTDALETVAAPTVSSGVLTLNMKPRSVHLLKFSPASAGGTGELVGSVPI